MKKSGISLMCAGLACVLLTATSPVMMIGTLAGGMLGGGKTEEVAAEKELDCDDVQTQLVDTSGEQLVGMTSEQAMAWFGGAQGPNNVCGPYAFGQCTWWACMRAHRLGLTTGSYWGNGQDWVSSAVIAGWHKTDSPVPGAVFSHLAGTNGSSASYGHTGIVESVDAASGTVTTSEKGGTVNVYSKTYKLPVMGMTFANPPANSTLGNAIIEQCKTDESGSPDGEKASPENAKKIARAKLKAYGWDNDEQWSALERLWTRESSWRWDADNPTSDAYGIPQSLPGSKMATKGADWLTNAATQIELGLSYIQGRYGSPINAWMHSEMVNWY